MKVFRVKLGTLWFRMPKCWKMHVTNHFHHAAVNILDGLYLLGTLSWLGISFPNRNYFIWPTYMITVPRNWSVSRLVSKSVEKWGVRTFCTTRHQFFSLHWNCPVEFIQPTWQNLLDFKFNANPKLTLWSLQMCTSLRFYGANHLETMTFAQKLYKIKIKSQFSFLLWKHSFWWARNN